jgi:hypothetical protein
MTYIRQWFYLIVFMAVFGLAIAALHGQQAPTPAPAGQKVPDDIALRIKNNQLDQARLQNQMLQMTQQYQADQQAIEKDNQEMNNLKAEALKAAKLDPATNDVDVERLVFVPKSAPPKAPEKK